MSTEEASPIDWDKVEKGLAILRGKRASKAPSMANRMYANAVPSRTNQGFPAYNSSADAELVTSLRNLRARSRQLVRDGGYAKSAKRVIVNNVVGTGIRLQALVQNTRGGLNARVNDSIEDTWTEWCAGDSCHTGGELHFHDMERQLMGQIFEAGEIFVRIHRQTFGRSTIPMALEVIEPERVVDGYAQPSAVAAPAQVRMGVEVDKFRRPLAYWVRDLHPGDVRLDVERTDVAERVPAADMFHLRVIDRWPQTRGEPWMHAVCGKLNDMNGYSEAEIIAARGAANYLGMIETAEDVTSLGEEQPDGTFQMPVQPGAWFRGQPGEKLTFASPNRPNAALDPFMRFMLREVAAGIGTSYESISRDYSQHNYSSQRQAMLEDRDLWRAVQAWIIRSFRTRLHREWLTTAVMAGAVEGLAVSDYFNDLRKYQSAIMRPRGWSWIDPTKEVAAYKEAVKAGFTTNGDVIVATGGGQDLEDVITQRADELAYMDEKNLAFDTSPSVYVPAETRGQMIIGEDGTVQPAAQAAPPAGAAAAPGAEEEPEPAEPAAATDDESDGDDEDAGAEPDEDERASRRVRRLKVVGGYGRYV